VVSRREGSEMTRLPSSVGETSSWAGTETGRVGLCVG